MSHIVPGRLVAIVLATTVLLAATTAGADDLAADEAWVRLAPPGLNAAAYLVLTNEGDEPRRIVGVSSDAAERTELHRSWIEDGVARMRRVEAIELPPGGEVRLAPKGLHVMLIRPAAMAEGQRVTLRFDVEGGAEIVVEAEVRRSAPGE